MKLTVVLPFHEQNPFLVEAIRSSNAAMPEDSELILLNTSQEKFILKATPRITHVIEVPGKNYIQALSIGLSHAKGELIALMNSDDLITVNRFERQIYKLTTDKADLNFCGLQKFKGSGRPVHPLLGNIKGGSFRSEYLLLGSYGANASWLFKSSWAKEVNLFSSNLDSSDWTTALRVFPHSKISYLPENLYLYRMHDEQITRKNPETHLTLQNNWSEFNSKLNLPDLSIVDIRQMTHPELFSKDNVSITDIEIWFHEYLALLGDSSIQVEEMIHRRLQLLSMRYPGIAFRNLKLSLLFKMTMEFMWNFTKPRNRALKNNL